MTTKQREAIDSAISAYIAARKTGVDEFYLIGEIFDKSNEFTIEELKKSGKLPIQKSPIELVREKESFMKIVEEGK